MECRTVYFSDMRYIAKHSTVKWSAVECNEVQWYGVEKGVVVNSEKDECNEVNWSAVNEIQ